MDPAMGDGLEPGGVPRRVAVDGPVKMSELDLRRGAVAWTLGEPCLVVHGGTSRLSGERSIQELHPIIAARGHARAHALDPTPALPNTALFARDQPERKSVV